MTGSRKGHLANDPRVANLTPEKRADRERMADLIDETIKKLEQNHSPEPHRSAGFHRRAALLLDPTLVREALAATQDAMQRERSGELTVHKGPAAYFGGAVMKIALREGIDLGMGERGVAAQIEAPARPKKTPRVTVPATTGAQAEETEDSTPESRARLYVDQIWPFLFKLDHDREPTESEREEMYEERLEIYRRGTTATT